MADELNQGNQNKQDNQSNTYIDPNIDSRNNGIQNTSTIPTFEAQYNYIRKDEYGNTEENSGVQNNGTQENQSDVTPNNQNTATTPTFETKNSYIPNKEARNEPNFKEETAAEVAAPIKNVSKRDNDFRSRDTVTGNGMGWLALAVSILSLFVWPVILGAVGIIVGFIARRRGARGLGAWAIGIGVLSIVVNLFIDPFV